MDTYNNEEILTILILLFCFCSFTDNKRRSLVLSQPYSYSLVSFMDFTAKQKEDNRDDKQVHWSCGIVSESLSDQ